MSHKTIGLLAPLRQIVANTLNDLTALLRVGVARTVSLALTLDRAWLERGLLSTARVLGCIGSFSLA